MSELRTVDLRIEVEVETPAALALFVERLYQLGGVDGVELRQVGERCGRPRIHVPPRELGRGLEETNQRRRRPAGARR